MNISQKGIELIKKFEGFSNTPYRCPAGKMTIGYGHVIQAEREKFNNSSFDKNGLKSAIFV